MSDKFQIKNINDLSHQCYLCDSTYGLISFKFYALYSISIDITICYECAKKLQKELENAISQVKE